MTVDTGELRPSNAGSRGSVCAAQSNLYLILPGNYNSSLYIFQASIADIRSGFKMVWSADGYDGEPLYDNHRLRSDNVLSIFTRTQKDLAGERHVVVLDFEL